MSVRGFSVLVGAFYLVVVEHCELLNAGGDDAGVGLAAQHSVDGSDEDLGAERAVVIHTGGEIEDERAILPCHHIEALKRLPQIEHLLLLTACIGDLPARNNGGKGIEQALKRDLARGTEQADAVVRTRDEGREGVGAAARRRSRATGAGRSSVRKTSNHSQEDEVPTGSAAENPARMCGEKPCVTA